MTQFFRFMQERKNESFWPKKSIAGRTQIWPKFLGKNLIAGGTKIWPKKKSITGRTKIWPKFLGQNDSGFSFRAPRV